MLSKRKLLTILTAGYIRQHTEQCGIYSPPEITQMIIQFGKCCDNWSDEYCTERININHNNNSITTSDPNVFNIVCNAFGCHVVKNGDIFIWKLKLKNISKGYIGIIQDDDTIIHIHRYNNNASFNKTDDQYHGCFYSINPFIGNAFCSKGTFVSYAQNINDNVYEIEMKLDLTQKIGAIYYKINGIDYGEAPSFKTIKNKENNKYRLYLCIYKADNCLVELL